MTYHYWLSISLALHFNSCYNLGNFLSIWAIRRDWDLDQVFNNYLLNKWTQGIRRYHFGSSRTLHSVGEIGSGIYSPFQTMGPPALFSSVNTQLGAKPPGSRSLLIHVLNVPFAATSITIQIKMSTMFWDYYYQSCFRKTDLAAMFMTD